MLEKQDTDQFRAALTQLEFKWLRNLYDTFNSPMSSAKKLSAFFDVMKELSANPELDRSLDVLEDAPKTMNVKIARQLQELIQGEDDRRREERDKKAAEEEKIVTRSDVRALKDPTLELVHAILTESCDSVPNKMKFLLLSIEAINCPLGLSYGMKKKPPNVSGDQIGGFISSLKELVEAEVRERAAKAAVPAPKTKQAPLEGRSVGKPSAKKPKGDKG